MTYYFNTKLSGDFETVKKRVIAELEKEGFGILTEIDVKATFKKKPMLISENIKFWEHAVLLLHTKR